MAQKMSLRVEEASDLAPFFAVLKLALSERKLLKCIVKGRDRTLVYEMVKADPINRSLAVSIQGNFLFTITRSPKDRIVRIHWYIRDGIVNDGLTQNAGLNFSTLSEAIPKNHLDWMKHYELKEYAAELKAQADKAEKALEAEIARWEKEKEKW